jgi:hypothetical protein
MLILRSSNSEPRMSLEGHFQPEILRAATHFAAGWLQKLTQIQPVGVSQLPAGKLSAPARIDVQLRGSTAGGD